MAMIVEMGRTSTRDWIVYVRSPCNDLSMDDADATDGKAAKQGRPCPPWLASHEPPSVDLTPCTPRELDVWLRGGEPDADGCEKLLVWAPRARGSIDLAIGEGLDALRQGDRLASLGYHLGDYARAVLDMGERAAETLARLARELRTRPLLRDAVRSGKVRIRAAETVLPVA